MKFAAFWGCKIPYYLAHYASSTRAVLTALGVDLIEPEFNCCGYPVRHLHFESFLFSAARNLALAEQRELDILTPCKCCFGTLKQAQHILNLTPGLKDEFNRQLAQEGLVYSGRLKIKHLLSVLAQDVGLNTIQEQVKRSFEGVKMAAHYGCHALRPSGVTAFDDPWNPCVFENLLQVTGIQCVSWARRLECCGNPLWGKNNQLSLELLEKKVRDARSAGADFLCAACTYCQIHFDAIQGTELTKTGFDQVLPSLLFPQVLGLSLGLSGADLGLDRHTLDVTGIEVFLKDKDREEPPGPEAGEEA
ncbi:MAG: CoB--CoM heterodisulfide reductase iron-sulfur subunit B family protein [Pseudomonadota bacterium]